MARFRILRVGSTLLWAVAACAGDDGTDSGNGADPPSRRVELRLETPDTVTLGLREQYRMVARVTYSDTGEPAPDRPIDVAVTGDAGGSVLGATRVRTGADGRAQATLTSGPSGPASFQVVLSTAQAPGAGADPRATVAFRVEGVVRGRLEVDYRWDTPVVVQEISTRVHAGARDCAAIPWPTQPPGDATQKATGPGAITFFDGLTAGQVYTVTALALGRAGQPVGTGCAVAPAIVGHGLVGLTLPLAPRPTLVTGTYELGARLRLAEALPGDIGAWVGELDDLLHDPAGLLAGALVDELARATGVSAATARLALSLAWYVYACPAGSPWSCNPDLDGDGSSVDDAVRVLFFERLYDLAPWLRDGLLVGGDLTALLSDLTVGGVLDIESVAPDGTVAAHWDWNEFVLTWRLGTSCDPGDACCGRRVLTGAEMQLAPIGNDFTGTLARRETASRIEYALDIPEQRLGLQYGNLARFAVEHLVLPALTGQPSIACGIESWIGCELDDTHYRCCEAADASCAPTTAAGLAAGDRCGCQRAGDAVVDALGGLGADWGLGPDAWASLCGLGLRGVEALVESVLARLVTSGSSSDYLLLGVHGVLADDDHDLQTDRVAAEVAGTLVIDHGAARFEGSLDGARERPMCRADADCRLWEACKVEVDPLDGCVQRPSHPGEVEPLPPSRGVCEQGVGLSLGGQPCSQGLQCWSGTCLSTGRCLELCTVDADCLSGASCVARSATVQLWPATATSSAVMVTVDACR